MIAQAITTTKGNPMPKYKVTVHFEPAEVEFDTDDFDVFKSQEADEAPEIDPTDPDAVKHFLFDEPEVLDFDLPDVSHFDLEVKK